MTVSGVSSSEVPSRFIDTFFVSRGNLVSSSRLLSSMQVSYRNTPRLTRERSGIVSRRVTDST